MQRLTIKSLLKEGTALFHYPVRATFRRGEGIVVVSVPKRHFKRAVKRNLLKRRIREAFRHNASILGDSSYDIFFYYVAAELESYDKISESIRASLADMVAGETD